MRDPRFQPNAAECDECEELYDGKQDECPEFPEHAVTDIMVTESPVLGNEKDQDYFNFGRAQYEYPEEAFSG